MHTHKHTDHTKFKLKTYNRSTSGRIKHTHTCLQTHTCSSMKTVNTTMTHSSMMTAKCKRQRSHLLPKVVQFEEGRSSLHLCLHQGRGVHLTNNQSTMWHKLHCTPEQDHISKLHCTPKQCQNLHQITLYFKTTPQLPPNYSVLQNNTKTCTKLHCISKHQTLHQTTLYFQTPPQLAPNYTVLRNTTRTCTKLHCTSKHQTLHQTTLQLAPNYTVLRNNTRTFNKLHCTLKQHQNLHKLHCTSKQHHNLHQTTLYSKTTPELAPNHTVLWNNTRTCTKPHCTFRHQNLQVPPGLMKLLCSQQMFHSKIHKLFMPTFFLSKFRPNLIDCSPTHL